MLKGAAALHASHQAAWIVEATIQNPVSSAEVIRVFQDAGYGVYWLYAPFVTPMAENPSKSATHAST